ncbi:MAG: hypothetical protein FD123_803 [Bacteroidetes bacterium]|nr:MAG: hypothetical protein FD123_803 [Bacteroidota bacterium]
MKSKLLNAVFLVLGIGLLWYQYNGMSPEQKINFASSIKSADYFWLAMAVIIGALAHLVRAVRWHQLLAPLGHHPRRQSTFLSVMVGYLANYAVPRLGEVMRCTTLAREEKVPFNESFGTVIVERIIDMLCLLLVFVITISVQFSQLSSAWTEHLYNPASEKLAKLANNPVMLIVVIGALLAVATAFFLLRKKISGKMAGIIKGFVNGIKAVRKVKNPGLFILYTLGIWFGYLMSLFICFRCFPETSGLSMNLALVLLLFGTFGVAFTPGGIGAYQVLVANVLFSLTKDTPEAVPTAVATSFAWVSWSSQVITVLIFTLVAFILQRLSNRRHGKA